jgi:hypothetical protein
VSQLIGLFQLRESLAGVGEHGTWALWIENLSTDEMTGIEVTVDAQAPGVDFSPYSARDRVIQPGVGGRVEGRWCPIHITTTRRGFIMVNVKVRAWFGGDLAQFVTEHPVGIRLEERKSGGTVNLTVDAGAAVENVQTGGGDLNLVAAEGMYTKLFTFGGNANIRIRNGAVVEEVDTRAPEPRARSSAGQEPTRRTLEQLPVVPLRPDWALASVLDLEQVYRSWAPGPAVVDISFVDGTNRVRSSEAFVRATSSEEGVTQENEYRVRVRLHQAGFLALFSQGSTGRHFVLFPSALAQVRPAEKLNTGSTLFWPGELLLAPLVDAAAESGERHIFGFDRGGTERVLAVLTKEPLFDTPTERPFDAHDSRDPASPVRMNLIKAWLAKGTAVGMATVQVREGGC